MEGGFDTAIAVNSQRFEKIDKTDDCSFKIEITTIKSADVAYIKLTEKITGNKIAVLSLHVPGYGLTDLNEKRRSILIKRGDEYCQKVAEKLDEIVAERVKVFIGADMNTNPELLPTRFQMFTDKGLQLIRSNEPTCWNPIDTDYQKREIDFIFENSVGNVSSKVRSLLTFAKEKNSSDHLAIVNSFSANHFSTEDSSSPHYQTKQLIIAGIVTTALMGILYLWKKNGKSKHFSLVWIQMITQLFFRLESAFSASKQVVTSGSFFTLSNACSVFKK